MMMQAFRKLSLSSASGIMRSRVYGALRFERRPILLGVLAGFIALMPAIASAEGREAAIVCDVRSGDVLFSRAADEQRYPASLTKMMTLYVLFQDLQRGRYSLNSTLLVSPYAAAQPRTNLGLKAGEAITVDQAIRALVVHSANDAAVVIAENLAGSEQAMADRMTRTARALGMASTQFQNASGLPHPNQYSTARDMMLIGAALREHFPQYFGYFSVRSFAFRGRSWTSHNRLIGRLDGVDGIKTGYIRASGFNVVTSVHRGGRLIVAVVMGGRTAKIRDQQMQALIEAYVPGDTARSPVPEPSQASISYGVTPPARPQLPNPI
jgi:D-alanyl-D-alanine carboxypeptidase